jgi:hypothetical protein
VSLHFLPQPPQLEGSVLALFSQPLASLPSQLAQPGSHSTTTHEASGLPLGVGAQPLFACGNLHAFPQKPQLFASATKLISQPFDGSPSQLPVVVGTH